jgi:hypothetical protein
MSNLSEFLREANDNIARNQFDLDYKAGLIPEEVWLDRLIVVGNPKAPLLVKSVIWDTEVWKAYIANYDPGPPEPPPEIGGTRKNLET